MKEATGELNMTVITVVAIAAIAAIFYAWVWPSIQVSIAKNTCESAGYTSCTITRGDLPESGEINCADHCTTNNGQP